VSETLGVLVMAYGSPESLEEVPAYFTHIRGGRPPSPSALEELTERYRALGGKTPFNEVTRAQARSLESALNAWEGRPRFRAFVGMRHTRPFIAEALAEMAGQGIRRAVAVAMTPHYSRMSVGFYMEVARKAVEEQGLPLDLRFVESWHLHPLYLTALAERFRTAWEALPPEAREGAVALFTAHSLPERIREWGDPYPRHLEETAQAVASALGLPRWRLAYQSASPTGEPWLGPPVESALDALAEEGVRTVVVQPIGFLTENLETLYDLDRSAQAHAEGLGLRFLRVPCLDDHPLLAQALAGVVRSTLQAG